MKTLDCDVAVIGGGPAGLAAALEARCAGAGSVVILERDPELGGILQQCIHTGFGLRVFGQDLTGPEYAARFVEEVQAAGIDTRCDTTALEITPEKTVYAVNGREGVLRLRAKAVVLAMGCRERARGAVAIPGTRPAGVYTAGTAQRLMNLEGYLPGRCVVILGSGDVGLIMARRLTLEGAEVKAVVEALPYPGGLARNVVQCLEDFGIPLMLSHTVVAVHGMERVSGVTIAPVDAQRRPVRGSSRLIACDTLLLSVGLIPENELSRSLGIEMDEVTGGPVVDERMETSMPGVFACGNVAHVHDLVDNVTREAQVAGRAAALCAAGLPARWQALRPVELDGGAPDEVGIVAGRGIRYVVPHRVSLRCPDALGREEMPLLVRIAEPRTDVRIEVALADCDRGNGHTRPHRSRSALLLAKAYPRVVPSETIEISLNLGRMADSVAALRTAAGGRMEPGTRARQLEVRMTGLHPARRQDTRGPNRADDGGGEDEAAGLRSGVGQEACELPVHARITCVVCPIGCEVVARRCAGDEPEVGSGRGAGVGAGAGAGMRVAGGPVRLVIEGFRCDRGRLYAEEELACAKRTLTTTVRVLDGARPLVSVRTRDTVRRELIPRCMKALARVTVSAPVKAGQVIARDVLGTGVDVVATCGVPGRSSKGGDRAE